MRVGLFTDSYSPQINGVTVSVIMLADGLRKLGHEVFIITTSNKDVKKSESGVMRIAGFNVPLKTLKGYQLVLYANRYLINIKALNLDIIHIHTEFSIGRFGVKCAKKLNIPMVYTLHTMYEEYMHHVIKHGQALLKGSFLRYVKNNIEWFSNSAKALIIPHVKVKNMLSKYNILSEVAVIPTGINLNSFYASTYSAEEIANLKKSLGINNEKVLLFVGRIANEKSIDLIINAFAKEVIKGNFKLVIVGNGPALKSLQDLAMQLKINEHIIFTGAVPWDKVGMYYQLGDIFVNASRSETQGLTYIEALAASLVLLVRYDRNLDGLIANNENGLFFENDEDFSSTLNKVLQDKELFNKIKANALPSVSNYSKEKYALNVSNLYERILYKK